MKKHKELKDLDKVLEEGKKLAEENPEVVEFLKNKIGTGELKLTINDLLPEWKELFNSIKIKDNN